MSVLRGVLMCCALFCAAATGAADRYALLIGVSSYPSLPARLQLAGPRNDVELMRHVLLTNGFAGYNIAVLADGVRGAREPTRAAILDGLKALAERAQANDTVVVYYSGHGSQQPARNLGAGNPEPDGLDEIILPRDVGRWKGEARSVENAIVDDELGAALDAIRARGAFVWAVFDTCHAGTMARSFGNPDVQYRQVPPSELDIPQAALDEATRRAAGAAARGAAKPMPMGVFAQAAAFNSGFVAFYATQSWERAPEQTLPGDDAARQKHGLFTYTLAQALAANPALTYRQAAQEVLQRYRARGQSAPTPLFEGSGLDTPVFGGAARSAARIWMLTARNDEVVIDAGALEQIGAGAVFAVVADAAAGEAAALGYLTATQVGLMQSRLAPLEYRGKPAPAAAAIPPGAWARLVEAKLALELRVVLPERPRSAGRYDAMALAQLNEIAKADLPELRVSWLPPGAAGDLALMLRDNRLWLLPPSGEPVTTGPAQSLSIDLAAHDAAQLRAKLLETLARVGKVVNLMRLSTQAAAGPLAQAVEMRLAGRRATATFALEANRVPALQPGDLISLEIDNRHASPVDVTVLFIDSGYGITPLFPRAGEANRIEAGGRFAPPASIRINAETTGRESLLMIAAVARPGAERSDFSLLAQPRLDPAQVQARGSGDNDVLHLMQDVGFEAPRVRGLAAGAAERIAIKLFSWDTVTK